jgi:predicted nucleotidyltransferase
MRGIDAMFSHHQRVIQRLVECFQPDPRFPAMIIGGSVAKGRARENSDVDIVLVAADEEYARRQLAQDYHYFNRDLCDYPDGYVDGKIVDFQFLLDVADHGSEPARAAFVGAFLGYSRISGLDEHLNRIPIYPECERQEKMTAFYSQVLILNWYIPEAEKRQDPYLLAHAAADLVLFGGRLILAYNRILYPYHKWFMYEVDRAPDKPADFVELAENLLKTPGKDSAQRFCDCIGGFHDWGVTMSQAVVRFMHDSEWNWRAGRPPLQDW